MKPIGDRPNDLLAGEPAAIARTAMPVTSASVTDALRAAGVRSAGVIIVHSSLSRLGWVAGEAHAVVAALFEMMGPEGTVVMPAHTGLSDPAGWVNPPVPQEWWQIIRDHVPAYDQHLTPLRAMGAVVDCFRHDPATSSSGHPAMAFVARGPLADWVLHPHGLEFALDDGSPLGRLYGLDAQIVLCGVGHENNTSLHLCEYRASYSSKATVRKGVPMLVDGVREWVTYDDIDIDSDDFPMIGAAFAEATGGERRVELGCGEVICCSMREIVDFGVGWIERNRIAPAPVQS